MKVVLKTGLGIIRVSSSTMKVPLRPGALMGVGGLLHLAATVQGRSSGICRHRSAGWVTSWRHPRPPCRGRHVWSSVDSARAGYFRTLDGAGPPDIDPVVRSQVRERLRQKRREPFTQEMGKEIMERMRQEGVLPVRVLVDVDLRQTLRLTRREKKARIFLPPTIRNDFRAFLDSIYSEFPVMGIPHDLVVKVRAVEEGQEDIYVTLETDDDLSRVWGLAEAAGQGLQVYIKSDKRAQAAQVPAYLIGMEDPRESPTMQTLSFYRFFLEPKDEDGCELLAKRLRALWEPFGALGRVYVASEGINAQMAVPTNVMKNFDAACRTVPELEKVLLNTDRQIPMDAYREDPAFDALHIRIREQVVADGGLEKPYNWEDCGNPMDPKDWHEKVNDPDALVLDCRNDFESEVGRFATAEPLNTSFFRDTWDVLKTRLKDVPKDKPLLTYCTGGIRCIKVGAWLKQEMGFTNVNRLEGGIISYARYLRQQTNKTEVAEEDTTIPGSKFLGINYVFDNRLGERITADVLATCDQCGVASDLHVNCDNPSCHVRFIQCSSCGAKYAGCCSRGCQQAAEEARAAEATKGTYPAPKKTIYPAALLDAMGEMETRGPPKKRMWLQPGPFQNSKLNQAFDQAIDDYVAAYSSEEPELLRRLRSATNETFPGGAHMVSGHVQGRLLESLTRLIGAKSVLELGTFTGYATLCFAEGLNEGGRVVTCEMDDRAADVARRFIAESPHGDKIDLRVMPAMDLLQSFASMSADKRPQFDMIFLDASKKQYKDYYDLILDNNLLGGAGLLIADNVLWKGLVPELAERMAAGEGAELPVEEYEARGFTKRQLKLAEVLHSFNMHVRADPRTEQAFLPLRDGLLIVRWKGFERTMPRDHI